MRRLLKGKRGEGGEEEGERMESNVGQWRQGESRSSNINSCLKVASAQVMFPLSMLTTILSL